MGFTRNLCLTGVGLSETEGVDVQRERPSWIKIKISRRWDFLCTKDRCPIHSRGEEIKRKKKDPKKKNRCWVVERTFLGSINPGVSIFVRRKIQTTTRLYST